METIITIILISLVLIILSYHIGYTNGEANETLRFINEIKKEREIYVRNKILKLLQEIADKVIKK